MAVGSAELRRGADQRSPRTAVLVQHARHRGHIVPLRQRTHVFILCLIHWHPRVARGHCVADVPGVLVAEEVPQRVADQILLRIIFFARNDCMKRLIKCGIPDVPRDERPHLWQVRRLHDQRHAGGDHELAHTALHGVLLVEASERSSERVVDGVDDWLHAHGIEEHGRSHWREEIHVRVDDGHVLLVGELVEVEGVVHLSMITFTPPPAIDSVEDMLARVGFWKDGGVRKAAGQVAGSKVIARFRICNEHNFRVVVLARPKELHRCDEDKLQVVDVRFHNATNQS